MSFDGSNSGPFSDGLEAAKTGEYDAVILDQPHAFLAGEYLQARHPDILFLNRTQGWEAQADEAMRALPPVGPAPAFLRGLAQAALRRLLSRHQDRVVACADGILAGCSPIPDYLERKYGYPRERVAVIPYGVTDEFIRRPVPTDPVRWRRILHVAQFAPFKAPEIVATLKEYSIRTCYYGHLHGNAIRYAVQGDVDGIHYKLVSADGLRFCPYRIN